MEEKYKIRPVVLEDRDTLSKWWESYDHMLVPSLDLLPEGGRGGFAIEKKGRMIAAAFVYVTNSDMGYIDFLVSDPNYKGKDKYKILTKLMEACSELAIELGCRIVWAMTTYPVMADIAKEMGHDVLDEKYSIIYTHHKAYKSVMEKQENGKASWSSLFTESN